MSNLWMCLNCTGEKGKKGKKFVSDVPVCSCGVDGRKPEYKAFITRCVWTHYDPPHPVIHGRGTRKRLCDGKPVSGHDPAHECSTGSVRVVTCPACLAHKDFPRVDGELVVPEAADFPV